VRVQFARCRSMAEEHQTLRFNLTRKGDEAAPRTFTASLGAQAPIRIGRNSGNDIVVDSRGVSQYHAELRLMTIQGASSPQLVIRDLSTNGTALLQSGGDSGAVTQLEKSVDTPLSDGCQILVPHLLKVTQDQSDRACLTVEILGLSEKVEKKGAVEEETSKSKAKSGSKRGGEAPEDVESCRSRFVNLLLNTKEVSAGTTYKQAEVLLASNQDWHAVDEPTRKECFGIFVEHLRNSGSKKKKKNKSKKKAKEASDDEEEQGSDGKSAASPEAKVSKSGKKHRRSGGGDDGKKSKRSHKKSRRSRSLEDGNSASPAAKRRRRRSRSVSDN